MFKKDFLIQGLNNPTIKLMVEGTGHFMQNIVPAWYQLNQVELTPLRAIMSFSPVAVLPNELCSPVDYCISVAPHTEFQLVAEEIEESSSAPTSIRYIILKCQKIDDRLGFVYTILKKETSNRIVRTSCIGITKEKLMLDGFTIVDEGTNQARHLSIMDIGVA